MQARYVKSFLNLIDRLVDNFTVTFRAIHISSLIRQPVHQSVSISIQVKMLLNSNSCRILKQDYL